VFSWFRNYARIINEMKSTRHKFLVLFFVKKHNDLLANGATGHLGPVSAKRRRSKSYACSGPKRAAKAKSRAR